MTALSISEKADDLLVTRLPALLLCGGVINGFLVRVIEAYKMTGDSPVLFGISPFELITIGVAALLYFEAPEKSKTEPGLAELLFLVAILVPSSALSWIATIIYGAYHALRTKDEERTATLLIIALGLCAIWSSIIMKWIAVPITGIEASIVWHAISFLKNDIAINGNIIGMPDGHRIVLLIGCTTAFGLPKTLLGFTAISLVLGKLKPATFVNGLLIMTATYAIANLIRLCIMSWSDPAFHLAHGPIGSNIFDAFTTAALISIAFLLSEKRA